jgi:hypothetical protein
MNADEGTMAEDDFDEGALARQVLSSLRYTRPALAAFKAIRVHRLKTFLMGLQSAPTTCRLRTGSVLRSTSRVTWETSC